MDPSQSFLTQVTPLVLQGAYSFCNNSSKIPSQSIRWWMGINYSSGDTFGSLYVPYYWSVYYHKGRDVVVAKNSRNLVYYKDPKRDPRLSGGYPFTRSNVVTTRSQWNQIREDAKKGLVIFTPIVGPAAAHPYFSDTQVKGVTGGMVGLTSEIDKIVSEESGKYLKALLGAKGLWKRTVEVSV